MSNYSMAVWYADRARTNTTARPVYWRRESLGGYNVFLMVYPDFGCVQVRRRLINLPVYWKQAPVTESYELYETIKAATLLGVLPGETPA